LNTFRTISQTKINRVNISAAIKQAEPPKKNAPSYLLVVSNILPATAGPITEGTLIERKKKP
jgi:hypothetical protein